MTEDDAIDVLICGAGAAGLTLAIDLARRGVSFRLIEKMNDPFGGSRGKGIQPRTMEVFEDLGIVDRIAASGAFYPRQREYHGDGSVKDGALFEAGEPIPSEPYGAPLLVPQFLTEEAMRERLAELGHAPEFGCALIAFKQDGQGVTARLANGSEEQTIRARYLVGTDGGRSFVRQALAVGFPGKTLGVRAIVADVTLTGLSRDVWHRFNEGSMEMQISFCPLAETGFFQLQGPVPLEGDIDLSAEGLSALTAERTGCTDIVIQSVSWASAFNMNARLADSYRVGRVFLAGDAAHTHPPTGGQGLNTSVQDAYNLGWKLAAVLSGAPEALLDSYEEERRPIAASMLGLAVRLLEDMKRGEIRRGREVRQLDIAYLGSSLSLEEPKRQAHVLAGSRAPDALLKGAAGQPARLFDLFKGPHWTLLGFDMETAGVQPRKGLHIHNIGQGGNLIDSDNQFRETYEPAPGDWILVRPDGYVGAVVSQGKLPALETYLHDVGLRAGAVARR